MASLASCMILVAGCGGSNESEWLEIERVETSVGGSFTAVVTNSSDVAQTGRIECKFIIAERYAQQPELPPMVVDPGASINYDLSGALRTHGIGGELILTGVEDCRILKP